MVDGPTTEASVHAQNHAEVEAKPVPEVVPAQPQNTVERTVSVQPQTQAPATPKHAQVK